MTKYYTPDYRRCGFMDPMVSADDSTEDDDKYVEASEYLDLKGRFDRTQAAHVESLRQHQEAMDAMRQRADAATAGWNEDHKRATKAEQKLAEMKQRAEAAKRERDAMTAVILEIGAMAQVRTNSDDNAKTIWAIRERAQAALRPAEPPANDTDEFAYGAAFGEARGQREPGKGGGA